MMWLLLVPLLGLTVFTLFNAPRFKRLTHYARANSSSPLVSVLVPARNEEANLLALLPTLVAQTYANIEVIVLDDHSSDRTLEVAAGSAVITHRGEWVRYSTPQGAEYIAVCLPAFSPTTVHRDPAP